MVKNADLVGYSFVRSEADVLELQSRLAELGADEKLGIVLKIETREGFDQLPALLLAAMRSRAVGVMIARGDLAVECGYQRLAEVQEEILWMCEAAHIPVIWATQVLEGLPRPASRRVPKSPMRPWASAPNASCSTRGPTSWPPCASSTTFYGACGPIMKRSAPCCGSFIWRTPFEPAAKVAVLIAHASVIMSQNQCRKMP